jgi:hypothetical protein
MPESKIKEMIKPLLYGAIGGAILTMIIGFAWGGWVTGGTAQERIDEAVLPLAAEICANNFKADPNFEKNLAALKKEDNWRRDTYIKEKGKWSIMAGDDTSKPGVADACVEKLSDLLK